MINYNGYNYIQRTIPPLFKFDYPNYEIIIADNGSEDESIKYLKSIKNINIIHSPRKGEKNYACNLAVSKAKGKYVLLMDNDFIITDNKLLQNLINSINSLPNTGCISLAYADEHRETTKGYGCYSSYYYSWEKPEIPLKVITTMHGNYVGSPNGSGLFFEKKIWEEVGGYDDFLPFGGDDDDLGMKLWLSGYKNYLYSKSIQIHIGIPERTDTKRYSVKFEKKVFAHLYTIVKNYRFANMLITILGYTIFIILKSLKQALERKSILPITSGLRGFLKFFRNLPQAIKKRRQIQDRRLVKKDVFLKIRPILK